MRVADRMRLWIPTMKGKQFTIKDIPEEFQCANISDILSKLKRNGEIKLVGNKLLPRGRKIGVYCEVKCGHIEKKKVVEKKSSVWEKIWPEYFAEPNYEGDAIVHRMEM